MNDAILVALIGAIATLWVAIIGWRKREQWESEKKHLEQQVGELYGPLWGMLQRKNALYNVAVNILPAEGEKLLYKEFNDDDRKVWTFFAETYFYPCDSQMVDLIETKSYLIDGEWPKAFVQFIRHQAIASCLHHLWKKHGKDTWGKIKDPDRSWPRQFEIDVESGLNTCKQKYGALMAFQCNKINNTKNPCWNKRSDTR